MVDHCAARRAYARQILLTGEERYRRSIRGLVTIYHGALVVAWLVAFAYMLAQLF